MKLDYNPEQVKKALYGNSSFEDHVTFKEPGEYLVRFVTAPYKVERIFYPTMVFDDEIQELKQAWKVIRRNPEEGCIIDELATYEHSLKAARSQRKSSALDPARRWFLAGFQRPDEPPVLKVFEIPYSILKRLYTLAEQTDPMKKGYLRSGPWMSWDASVRKIVDPNVKQRQFATSWEADVYKAKFAGEIPVDVLTKGMDETQMKGFFSEAEWAAIESSTIDLEEETKPHTDEEIVAQFEEFPLFLQAERDNAPMFEDPEGLAAIMQNSNLKMIMEADGSTPAALPAGAGQAIEATATVESESDSETEEEAPAPSAAGSTRAPKWAS